MFQQLKKQPRLLLEQELVPLQGSRFQPTGFADLGAATYELPDKTQMLLVESAQSVANRLEKTCLDGDGPRLDPALDGLPYVVARLIGATTAETSSLVEAHRINSPFIIKNPSFQSEFLNLSKYDPAMPINWKLAASAVFFYDPSALLHGVFMSNLDGGRLRFPRAVTGFIEASDVREAVSGGVKNNHLDPSGKRYYAEGEPGNVYGNVPYPRVEYTAGKTTAFFNIDLALIYGYGLPEPATSLLIGLALLKIRRFLNSGLRLRTACDFQPRSEITVNAPASFAIPDEAALLKQVQEDIKACETEKLFASPAVTELTTRTLKRTAEDKGKGQSKKEKNAATEVDEKG